MRTILLTLAATAVLAGSALDARPRMTPEEELAKLIEGRQAGEPVRCISNFGNVRVRVIDRTALVFRDGRRIYVNRPSNARDLDSDDILVSRQFGTQQYCKLDVMRLVDRTSGINTGFVNLGEFVPYSKPR